MQRQGRKIIDLDSDHVRAWTDFVKHSLDQIVPPVDYVNEGVGRFNWVSHFASPSVAVLGNRRLQISRESCHDFRCPIDASAGHRFLPGRKSNPHKRLRRTHFDGV
jgi:hypothetical protein